MLSIFIISFLWARFVEKAKCHGFVHSIVANGQEYPGWNPFSDPYNVPPARVVRKVLNDGFVAGSDPDLPCHHGGNDGTNAFADADAGSQIIFQWSYWPADHQGPVSTYMASCGNDCSTFPATMARWFKVDATGYDPDSRRWAADMLRSNNNSWVSTIPAQLSPGQYLIRNEIIALHSITPQYYPSCSQINVVGTGVGQPSESDLVSMQALYSNVVFPNIYGDVGTFNIPGPPPVKFGDSGDGITNPTTNPIVASAPTKSTGTQSSSSQVATLTPSRPPYHCLLGSRRLIRRRSR